MPLRPPVSDNDHSQGNPQATVVLVEYGDYQCPHCGRAYPLVKELQSEFGKRLRFIFRNFPLTNVHPQAMLAAISSEAAAIQGNYWEMHDMLFENQRNLSTNAILKYAKELKLEMQQFEGNLSNPGIKKNIETQFYGGMRSGVNATPTFFINGQILTDSWEGDGLSIFLNDNFPG